MRNVQSDGKEEKKAMEMTAPISNKIAHMRYADYKMEGDVQRTIWFHGGKFSCGETNQITIKYMK